jgi:hypothetical protein
MPEMRVVESSSISSTAASEQKKRVSPLFDVSSDAEHFTQAVRRFSVAASTHLSNIVQLPLNGGPLVEFFEWKLCWTIRRSAEAGTCPH